MECFGVNVTDYKKLTDMLRKHEGLRLRPYKCSANALTIGFGRNLEANGISQDEANYLLVNDINSAIAQASAFSWYSDLNGPRKAVIADMIFNLGINRFGKFKNTIKAISEGRYSDAADGMLDSLWAKQVGPRATRLAAMMRHGRWED